MRNGRRNLFKWDKLELISDKAFIYNINIKKEVDETDRQSETRSRRIQTTKKIVIL